MGQRTVPCRFQGRRWGSVWATRHVSALGDKRLPCVFSGQEMTVFSEHQPECCVDSNKNAQLLTSQTSINRGTAMTHVMDFFTAELILF